MIRLLEKLGDYYFYWVEIWYRILQRAGMFMLLGPCCFAQGGPGFHPFLKPVAEGLTVPWDIEWLGDSAIIFTQIDGSISSVDVNTGEVKELYRFADVARELQSGLMGLALHPDFSEKPFVFASYTAYKGDALVLRVAMLEYSPKNGQLVFLKNIIDNIPAHSTDIGGRLLLAPDNMLYLSVGDNEQAERAQDLRSLNGKILRYHLDGTIPSDNPFPGSPVFALGIRNSQGLVAAPGLQRPARDSQSPIYFTEHGTMSDDELNLLRPGANYGWQLVAGYCDNEPKSVCENIRHHDPMRAWTPTVAPAGVAFYHHDRYPALKNSLLMANLFDQSLKCLFLGKNGGQIMGEQDFITEEAGRLRDVLVSPDGRVFVCTSNADVYGAAPKGSDKVYEVVFSTMKNGEAAAPVTMGRSDAQPVIELTLDSTVLEIRILAQGLIHPWDMTWGFDNRIWFTENGGFIKRLDPVTGAVDTLLQLGDCHSSWGNPGIYSLAFHPDFPKEPFLFVHYTNSATNSKLVRFRYDFGQDALTDSISILPKIKANESQTAAASFSRPIKKCSLPWARLIPLNWPRTWPASTGKSSA